ncbi:MAG: TetR/AcrR family transcriptional regulator [Pseudomonadota bacterium]
MATQKQRSDATRSQLLKAFRNAFLKHGFEATTTQQVLAQTGLSKGAMYHHFKSKTEIAEAIYRDESKSAIERALKSVAARQSPKDKLKMACLAWMQEVRAPRVSKILFEIGPTALGTEKAKRIEDALSLKLISTLLDEAVANGELSIRDTSLFAVFLNALVAEAAQYTLRTGTSSDAALADAIEALVRSVENTAPDPPSWR